MSPRGISTTAATAGLGALAAVHVAWATGSPWPLADRAALADAVVGRAGGEVPSPAACLAVASALTTAASLVSGRPRRMQRLRGVGVIGVVATLGTRGAFGLAGRTDLLSPGSSSRRFRALDRRFYSPICLTLAALSLPAASQRRP
jgi:hypothetical protein